MLKFISSWLWPESSQRPTLSGEYILSSSFHDDFPPPYRKCAPETELDRNVRVDLASMPCMVTAWPSLGGVVIQSVDAIQLQFLGLSRFEPTPSLKDQAAEDTFALRLLQNGATWWTDIQMFDHHQAQLHTMAYDFHYPPRTIVGHPSDGGVLVLQYSQDARQADLFRKPYLPEVPKGFWPRFAAALTMDEQCDVLRQYGAKFYEDVERCPELPNTIDGAYRHFKVYESLLTRMENPGYLDHWVDTSQSLEIRGLSNYGQDWTLRF